MYVLGIVCTSVCIYETRHTPHPPKGGDGDGDDTDDNMPPLEVSAGGNTNMPPVEKTSSDDDVPLWKVNPYRDRRLNCRAPVSTI